MCCSCGANPSEEYRHLTPKAEMQMRFLLVLRQVQSGRSVQQANKCKKGPRKKSLNKYILAFY